MFEKITALKVDFEKIMVKIKEFGETNINEYI